MRKQNFLISISTILVLLLLLECGSGNKIVAIHSDSIQWIHISKGVDYADVDAPIKSDISDNKISIIRIEPQNVQCELYFASKYGKRNHSIVNWAKKHELNLVFNAGMYSLKNMSQSNGYACSGNHINNPEVRSDYGGMLAFNPKNSSLPIFNIFDLNQTSADSAKCNYSDLIQNIRMIGYDGKPVFWKKDSLMRSSMIVAGIDSSGRMLVIFSRSPFHANQMTNFMLELPLKIAKAVYLEGGPEAGFYIKTHDTIISKVGSYVTKTFETNLNTRHWEIPNIVGIKFK